MLRRLVSILLWPVVMAACSSDPDVPAASGSSSDDGATSTGAVGPDGDPSTSSGAGTTESGVEPDGTTFAATEAVTSTAGSESTTSAGDTDTDGTSTDGTSTDGTSTDGTSTGEPPAICGDGIVDAVAGEACDDGGESATCNVDCTVAMCGDGLFNATAGEACDDAGGSAACNADCTLAACGDGQLNGLAGEACDDGGESITCNADCSLASCGDGITNATAGEACDDDGESLTCDADCTLAACGDGQLNAVAGEACDGPALAGESCQTFGYLAGTLACTAGCSYDTSACANPPAAPVLTLGFSPIKQLDLSWMAVPEAEHYQLLERASPGDPYVQLGGDLVGESAAFEVPLHLRWEASYVLRACNAAGCTDSAEVDVVGSLAEAVGYVKASSPEASDFFGYAVALSADGSTLAVGAYQEDSSATGIGGNQADNGAPDSGAVYVFVRAGAGAWSQQAYIKASNTGASDYFGYALALSSDGSTLAVGAWQEDSNATGIGGNQANNSASSSGAAYVFVRDGAGAWSQQAYVKASNTGSLDRFGINVKLSGSGDTLAVGAYLEASNATGIGGNQADNSVFGAGAVYVFVRDGAGAWSQQAYVKASNSAANDYFGGSLALSGSGSTLAVAAAYEASSATGVGGNQADNSAFGSGAVYVFERDGAGAWSQQAYVKASNTGASDRFGVSVALSEAGDTLAVGADLEDSNATGIGGNQANDNALNAGAVYVFARGGGGAWSQQAYIKPSNTGVSEWFGDGMALSGDGNTLAVGARLEDSNATGLGGNQADDRVNDSGAVYLY